MNLIKKEKNNKQEKKKNKNTEINIKIFIIIFTIIFIGIIFGLQVITSNCDKVFHLQRLMQLADEIKLNGILKYPYYINFEAFGGIGYATELFYGDLFLIIPAMIINLGVNANIVYSSIIGISVILIFFSMHFAYKYFNKDKKNALIISYIYTFSTFLAFELLERNALGTNFAYIFVPWTVFSFMKIIYDKGSVKKNIIILALSMAAMIVSHLQTSIIIVLGLILYLLLNIKSVIKNKKSILEILIAAIMCILIDAYYLFPMIEQIFFQKLYIFSSNAAYIKHNLYEYLLNPLNIFCPNFVWKKFYGENIVLKNSTVIDDIMKRWTLPSCFIAMFYLTYRLLPTEKIIDKFKNRKQKLIESKEENSVQENNNSKFKKNIKLIIIKIKNNIFKERTMNEKIILSTIVLMIIVILGTFTKLICFDNILGFLQFPWRILTISMMFLPIGFILANKDNEKVKKIAVVVVTFVLALYLFALGTEYIKSYKKDYVFTRATIGFGEYLPEEVPNRIYGYQLGAYLKKDKSICVDNKYIGDGYKIELNIENDKDKNIQIPVIYYKGYKVYNYYEDLDKYEEINYSKGDTGLIKIKATCKYVVVKYEGTKIQKISKYISIMSVILIFIFISIFVYKNKNKIKDNKKIENKEK